MTDKIGFKIIDVELNDVNGGSFSVVVANSNSSYKENTILVNKILDEEKKMEFHTLKPFEVF